MLPLSGKIYTLQTLSAQQIESELNFYLNAMKSVNRILTAQSSGLQTLLERAEALNQIRQRLQQILPAPVDQHVHLANIRDNSAVIIADSAVWLTKARYLAPDILGFLRQEAGLEQLQKVLFKVEPPVTAPQAIESKPKISDNTAELLVSTAKIVADPKLKASLINLSRRHYDADQDA
ncbi:DUF721 domain-containing protein [Kaarinaea lacus]